MVTMTAILFPNILRCYSFILKHLLQQTSYQMTFCSRGLCRLEWGRTGIRVEKLYGVLDVAHSSPVSSGCLWLSVKSNPGAGQVENCCPWVSTKACVRLNRILCFLTDVGSTKSSKQFGDLWKRSEKGGYKNEMLILHWASHLLRSLSLEGNEDSGDSPGWTFWL